MKRLVTKFAFAIPVAWAALSLCSFYNFRGDEYVLWALLSLPGLWVAMIDDGGDIHGLLPKVILGGVAVCAVLGYGIDWLVARRRSRMASSSAED